MTAHLLPLQLHQAEQAVKCFTGYTHAEMAEAIGAKPEILRDRLLDLEQLGKAHRRGFNTCRVTGKPSAGWHAGPVRSATTEKPGALNPQFVCWLMGFPPEWDACAPTAMPSSRKKPPK